MMIRFALCAAVVASTALVTAQQTSAFRKQDIRAGVLVLTSNPNSVSPAGRYFTNRTPHVFYNLDSVQSVKPAAWNFVNPRSAGTLNAEDFSRWSFIDPSLASPANVARINNGFRLQKSHAAYWEVKLENASDADLSDYDILMMAPQSNVVNPVFLDPESREKLRKFVDKGGVLWVDTSSATFDPFNGLPIPFANVTGATANWNANFGHPLLRVPMEMGVRDLDFLHSSGNLVIDTPGSFYGGALVPLIGPILGAASGASGQPTGLYAKMLPVATATNATTIGVARIGEGYMVVTTREVAPALNAVVSNLGNFANFFASRPQLTLQGQSAAKLAVNMVNLASEATMAGAGSRRSGSIAVDLGSPLVRTFSDTYPAGQEPPATPWIPRAPVIYKGMTFVVGQTQISAYDANPQSDIDRNGNPDDGIRDLSDGEDRDLVFRTQPVAGGISSAVCVEVPDAQPGIARDQLLVTDRQGRLWVYPIFDSGALQFGTPVVGTPVAGALSPAPSAIGLPPLPPTVHEGLAFVPYASNRVSLPQGPQGAFWIADLRTLQPVVSNGGNFGFHGGNDSSTRVAEFTSSPVVGYIPNGDGAGYDKVLYGATAGDVNTPAGFVSVWIGSKGERPAETRIDGTDLIITTRLRERQNLRIFNPGAINPNGFRISLVDAAGIPLQVGAMEGLLTGSVSTVDPATLRIGLTAAGQAISEADWQGRVRIDYSVDLGPMDPNQAYNALRGRVQFPVNPNAPRQVTTGLALSPNGGLFATTSVQMGNPVAIAPAALTAAGGSLFSFKELGLGQFQLAYRWDLSAPGVTFSPQGAPAFGILDPLPDNDPVQYLRFGAFSVGNFIGGPLRNATFVGGPVIRNGNVYCTVIGNKAGFVRASALLCFQADPPVPEIRLPFDVGDRFQIIQPDISRAVNPLAPTNQEESRIGLNEVRVERSDNNTGSVLRFLTLMGNVNGQMQNSISTSLPVFLRRPNQPDFVIDPMRAGGRWDPLQWYTIMHGTAVNGPAFVSGSTLFVSGSSALPKILDLVIPFSQNDFDGINFGINTDVDISSAVPVNSPSAAVAYPNPSDPNVTLFEPKSLVADATRPWRRQLISMDYPRAAAGWTSSQFAVSAIYPNQNYVWPQSSRNRETRGKTTFDDFKLRVLQAVVPTNNSFGVVGGDGALIAWNSAGIFGYRRSETWIADEGRIGLYDSAGNVLFDSSFNLRFAEAINGNAGRVTKLVRPTRVKPVADSSDMLIVDSGANRVLRMSPTGIVSRSIEDIFLDPAFTPAGFKPGDPDTLSNPRDVVTYRTYVAQANNPFSTPRPLEEWTHYLVADSGNNRLLELVDRAEVNGNGVFIQNIGQPGTLFWQSQSEVSGKGFAYNSISAIFAPDNTNQYRRVFVAGVGGRLPGKPSAGERPFDLATDVTNGSRVGSSNAGGGVVIFDSSMPSGYVVYDSFAVPAIPAIHRWNDRTQNWTDPGDPEANIFSVVQNGTNKPVEPNRPFLNMQSVTVSFGRFLPNEPTVLRLMVADASGVYEMSWNPTLPAEARRNQGLSTRWMITSDAYSAMRQSNFGGVGSPFFAPTGSNPSKLLATYARRIDDENVIIVNGFVGLTRGRRDSGGNWAERPINFAGEVVQIDGRVAPGPVARNQFTNGFNLLSDNLGFSSRSIRFRLGPVEGARDLSLPVFADRR